MCDNNLRSKVDKLISVEIQLMIPDSDSKILIIALNSDVSGMLD